ncbi:MAG: FAD-binding oxidoreductase [Pseudomonadota bacterium]
MTSLLTINDHPFEYPPSYYAATANAIEGFPALEGEHRCDVCVIGGGFTGLSSALHLAERGYNVILLEAHRVGWGASGRNGGQMGSGQRQDQDSLEKLLGLADARRLWDLGEAAKQLIRDLVAKHDIACDLKPGIIHADHRARFVADSHAYVEKLNRDYGYEQIQSLSKSAIREHLATDFYHGGNIDWGAGHLHPLNFALGLAQAARGLGAQIFERSQVLKFQEGDKVSVKLDRGEVKADFVLLGCNGYLDKLEPRVAARSMPINNYIVATEPLGEDLAQSLIREDTAVADSKFVVNYYRLSADRRMLFGGGETYRYKFPEDIKSIVLPHMLQVYAQLRDVRIDYAWGGTLAITLSRLPYFARLSKNVLTASGYSGQGVAMGTLAGQILADAVAGTSERFDLMSSIPTQSFPGGPLLRWPLLVLAMVYYSLRDKI